MLQQRRRQRLFNILIIVLMMMSITACTTTPSEEPEKGTGMVLPPNPSTNTAGRRPWNDIHNWVYWLDTPNLQQIAATNFELAVIDYSANNTVFSAQQITALRQATCQRRVVAYLSIGEAESYRPYWQAGWQTGNPSWLGTPDVNWAKNYWVNYWDPAWQQTIYHYLDAIIAAGFDGIYLDRVDAYQEHYAAGHENDMVNFVTNIAQYARTHSPLGDDFGIIVQNAEGLAVNHPDYVHLVTGIGREEVYVKAMNKPTSDAARARTEQRLDLFRQGSRGQLVLTVDYTDQADLVSEAYEQSQAKGYVPYATTVNLNHIQTNADYEPDCNPLT
ncbi:MAG TPA: MJ1477/TM1410 family putative glycoside hydrolase [Ktedonobacteraceae bacterium]|jgi:cysteinyl-tRNA synthetase|nr:MJ1477/TM1410 family putative glycoside hydrolase [Ktedonobacteraceae bacterium]